MFSQKSFPPSTGTAGNVMEDTLSKHFAHTRKTANTMPPAVSSADVRVSVEPDAAERARSPLASEVTDVKGPDTSLLGDDTDNKYGSVSKPKRAALPINSLMHQADGSPSPPARPTTPYGTQNYSRATPILKAPTEGANHTPSSVNHKRQRHVSIMEAGKVTPIPNAKPATTLAGSSHPSAASLQLTARSAMPIAFNPALPAYILDRIHPCIPLPAQWTIVHDQYIVSLDIEDFHLPAIVRRVKQHYPELRDECITPGMIDKRLRILDLRVEWQGWKRALEDVRHDTLELDEDEDDSLVLRSDDTSPADAKKAILVVDHRGRRNSCVSTGGRSGKITITKRGTSFETVDDDGTTTLPITCSGQSPSKTSKPTKVYVRPPTPSGFNMLSGTTSTTVALPPSPPPTPQVAPRKAIKNLRFSKDTDAHVESIKKREAREYAGAKARPPKTEHATRRGDAFGVPSVMRTSSGRPILR